MLANKIFSTSPTEQRSSVLSCPGHASSAPFPLLGKCSSYPNRQSLGTTAEDRTHARGVAKAQESPRKDRHEILAVRNAGELDMRIHKVCKLLVTDLDTLDQHAFMAAVMSGLTRGMP